jgi:hypothetical protein
VSQTGFNKVRHEWYQKPSHQKDEEAESRSIRYAIKVVGSVSLRNIFLGEV